VRGNNLSGVIRFTYASGIQTTSTATLGGNAWMIFFEGQVYNGTTFVAINNGSLSGVLEEGVFFDDLPADQVTSNSNSSTVTSGTTTVVNNSSNTITVSAQTYPVGYFNGTIDNKSPNGAFDGEGELSYIVETDTVTTNEQSNSTTGDSSDVTTTSTTTGKVSEDFKFKGVRITFGS
jgi:hypothetical protein